MRLSDEAAIAINQLVCQMYGCLGAELMTGKKGGAIDLYIEAGREIQMTERLTLMSKLQRAIGLREIDLVIRMPNSKN